MITGPFREWAIAEESSPATQQVAPQNISAEDESAYDLVRLSQIKQTVAGLQTQILARGIYHSELQASANVIDIQPLLALREQYFTAQIEVQAASSALSLAKQTFNRTQDLYRYGVNSHRQLQEQQIILSAARARLASSQNRLQSISDSLASQWGTNLSKWAKDRKNPDINSLINNQQAILLLSVPAGHALSLAQTNIEVDPNSDRKSPQTARFISNAPQGSELSQGETYFFITPRAKLRTGMRLSAWLPNLDTAQAGFIIPASALIWHMGLATIYLKTAPELFKRLSLTRYYPIAQGYFVADALPDNSKVVSTGAQILLSHELRALIPVEDTDDGGD